MSHIQSPRVHRAAPPPLSRLARHVTRRRLGRDLPALRCSLARVHRASHGARGRRRHASTDTLARSRSSPPATAPAPCPRARRPRVRPRVDRMSCGASLGARFAVLLSTQLGPQLPLRMRALADAGADDARKRTGPTRCGQRATAGARRRCCGCTRPTTRPASKCPPLHALKPAESRRDPLVVLVLAILFIGSVVCLHLTQNFFRSALFVQRARADARHMVDQVISNGAICSRRRHDRDAMHCVSALGIAPPTDRVAEHAADRTRLDVAAEAGLVRLGRELTWLLLRRRRRSVRAGRRLGVRLGLRLRLRR